MVGGQGDGYLVSCQSLHRSEGGQGSSQPQSLVQGWFLPFLWPPSDLRSSLMPSHSLTQANGEFRQNGNTSYMLSDIPRLIEHCSSIMRLDEGDLILTGTPEGVSQVVAGDKITCGLDEDGKELATLTHTMIAREGGYQFNPYL